VAIPEKKRRRPDKWVFGAPIGTPVAVISQAGSIAGVYSIPKHKGPLEENLRLRAENAKLRVENETLRAKVITAMQEISYQQTEEKRGLTPIIVGIIDEIQEEFQKLPLISAAYYALCEKINEISVNVLMDSLDYDTENELIKFFIIQEDKFPHISIRTRFPVLSIEEAEVIYPREGFILCYKRDK
jgi:hypothetical protein